MVVAYLSDIVLVATLAALVLSSISASTSVSRDTSVSACHALDACVNDDNHNCEYYYATLYDSEYDVVGEWVRGLCKKSAWCQNFPPLEPPE